MKFILSDQRPEQIQGHVLALPTWENGKTTSQQVRLNSTHGKEIRELVDQTAKEEKFNGETEKILFLPLANALPYKRLLLVGMGKQKDLDAERVRRFAAWAICSAEKVSATTVVFDLEYFKTLDINHIVHALTEGSQLGGYKFLKYKSDESLEKMQITNVEEVIFCGVENRKHAKLDQIITTGQLYARATMLARDLINEPAGDMTPKKLLETAQKITQTNPDITLKYFDRAGAKKMGMNAFLGIAAGSDQEPYVVHLTYKPKKNPKGIKIAMVGKGITFDSGGLSIKPAEAMFDMKIDMSGAANVLGVFSVLSKIKPNVQIEGIFTACENMSGGSAIKPGDVVTAMSGKTIEILNTDAEGRVCLADSISYAKTLKPDYIVDFATLTGACMVSLGEEVCAGFTNDPTFYKKFIASCEVEGERAWELPLIEDYKKKLESGIADIKNVADNRWGGAITAALFIQEFVGETPWIHFDIAGPSGVWTDFHVIPYIQKGGTGFGVRSFLHFVKNNF